MMFYKYNIIQIYKIYPCLCYSQGPMYLNQFSLHTEMGEKTLLAGTPTQTTGYPLKFSECSFTVMRGPLSGNQAPHRLALLLFGFTLQGGRTTYPASPQGNNQLGRNEFTVNNAALLHNVHNTVTKYKFAQNVQQREYKVRNKESNTNRHLQLGSVACKQVFFQVSTISNKFLQSYTCAANRSTALSTTVLQLDQNPAAQSAIAHSRLRQNYPKTTKQNNPGPL